MRAGNRLPTLFVAALLLQACSFDPPTRGPGPIGTRCSTDAHCSAGRCVQTGATGICSVCAVSADCGPGSRCDLSVGQCVGEPAGPVATDGRGRHHAGRVGAVPISAYRQGAQQ